jgi:pyruvate/2-oxoglutarate/acetoin dehydrogenase E1 component
MTVSRAFAAAVAEEMARDDSIFVLGTDLFERGGHFAQIKGLGQRFGAERVRDAPISEAALVAAGVGAAMQGMRPIVDLNFIDFALGAMDEIINQAAKMRYMSGVAVPLVIRATSGIALYAAQHNNSLEATFAHTPGLLVAVPTDPADTAGLIKSALRGEDPVIFLMHKRLAGVRGPVSENMDALPFGRAAIRRQGAAATLVTYGATVRKALDAGEHLAEEGIEVEVIDLRTLYPLDLELVERSVRKTGRLVVISEAPCVGGIAAEVAAAVQEGAFDYLDAPVVRVGAAYSPIPHSPPLIDVLIPQVSDIEQAVRSSLARWPPSDV